jgi:NAD(P)-dependent dehydrogenase (short-subunit alcohol dehydrogenase family)
MYQFDLRVSFFSNRVHIGGVEMDLGLKGRKAIVVGGSRGIGKAIARGLAAEGVEIALVARDPARLAEAAAEISAECGRDVAHFSADAGIREQVDACVATAVEALGGLHILINSGSAPGGSATAVGYIDTIVDEDFLEDFNVKYLGALRFSRAAIPHLKEAGWGRIINISGLNARIAGNLSGGARNGSMVHLTKTLSTQLGRSGITVNCIHPGLTRTERMVQMYEARAAKKGLEPGDVEAADYAEGAPRANAIGRMIDASEIADLTSFLCSDRSWAVNGEVIAADGGGGQSVYY